MSEWKYKVKKPVAVAEAEADFCTGWGIVDGIISCISNLKKKRKEKKSQK